MFIFILFGSNLEEKHVYLVPENPVLLYQQPILDLDSFTLSDRGVVLGPGIYHKNQIRALEPVRISY
jgi:hypothetical protein